MKALSSLFEFELFEILSCWDIFASRRRASVASRQRGSVASRQRGSVASRQRGSVASRLCHIENVAEVLSVYYLSSEVGSVFNTSLYFNDFLIRAMYILTITIF